MLFRQNVFLLCESIQLCHDGIQSKIRCFFQRSLKSLDFAQQFLLSGFGIAQFLFRLFKIFFDPAGLRTELFHRLHSGISIRIGKRLFQFPDFLTQPVGRCLQRRLVDFLPMELFHHVLPLLFPLGETALKRFKLSPNLVQFIQCVRKLLFGIQQRSLPEGDLFR